MTIVRVIDLETTGTDAAAEVCEAGYCDVNVEERLIGKPRSWVCRVSTMPPEARAIHNITLAESATMPRFDAKILDGSPNVFAIAAHNADFDMRFFHHTKPVICTYKAALRVWPDAPGFGKDVLRCWLEDRHRIALDPALALPSHRAGPDAYVTAHIFLALLNAGATGKEMVAWTREPALLPKCPIGEFRGEPWKNVQAGFLRWMVRQETMEADLKWNAQREMDRRGIRE